MFNGTKIKNLNLKLHGVLVSPDGKESMYYKGKPYNEYKEKFDRAKDKLHGDDSNRPEPPKDADGNPLPPPDNDNSNRHESPDKR